MHKHACDYGHYWDCNGTAIRIGDSEPSVCMCLDHNTPMEVGDHAACIIEILTCPFHRQNAGMDGTPTGVEPKAEDGWVPIQCPNNLDKMLDDMVHSDEPRCGWCLLCNSPIRNEEDFIPDTYTHNCERGRALEAKIASESQKLS